MSHSDTRIAIEKTMQDNWAEAGVPVFYDNVKIETPNGPFLRHKIMDTSAVRSEINGGTTHFNRYTGVVQIDVVVPENTGTHRARQLADIASAIYRGKSISYGDSGQITFRIPSTQSAGVMSGYYRLVVRCPFDRDVYE